MTYVVLKIKKIELEVVNISVGHSVNELFFEKISMYLGKLGIVFEVSYFYAASIITNNNQC